MSEQTDFRDKVEDLFHEAQARPSHEARLAYLDGACEGNPGLRTEVEALLASAEQVDSYLEKPPALGETIASSVDVSEGSQIGRYKLLQQLGEGGFGVVYMAQQTQPVRRQVAIKVIKPGMDSKEVIARFEAERQALAMMDHPNIAKVLDAGTIPEGRPYFVMELVKGRPITEYCDANHLTTNDRLKLFVQVCNAVQHAHQKGVIHRDLKPSNVMITLHDGKPVPKVIDFGVSKALSQQLTDKTLFTRYGQIIGTPQYMSPEQAEMSGLDIDTRSDIYSLGVLLYELLTGQPPFDSETLRKAGFEGMRRLICETQPSKPSTKVKTLEDESATEVANHRSSAAIEALSKVFAGDLDWIVMKTLDKDRSRRYETATGLVQDIERHLADEPVQAGPPSLAYHLSKLYRRHRVVFVSAGAIAATVIVASCFAIAAWMSASLAHQESERAYHESEKALAFAKREQNEKEAIIEQLRIKIIDRALVYAWNGDLDLVERCIAELNLISEDPVIAEVLRSQTYLFNRENELAIIHAQKAKEIDRTRYAALATLSLATLESKNAFNQNALGSSEMPRPKSNFDRLIGANLFIWIDPERSIELADGAGALSEVRVANFYRSVAYANLALLTKSETHAERSLHYAKIFQRQSNDSVISVTMNLYCRIALLLSMDEIPNQLLEEANQACEDLRPYADVYFTGRTIAWYLALFGDPESALSEWRGRVNANKPEGTDIGHFAAYAVLQGKGESVQTFLQDAKPPLNQDPEFILAAAYTSLLQDSEPHQVRTWCERLLESDAQLNLKCEALGLLSALGDQEEISQRIVQLRSQAENVPKKIGLTLEFLDGKIDAPTFKKLIREAGHTLECQILTIQPDFFVGLWHLGRGERDDAKREFQSSLQIPCYFEGWFWWSKAILNSNLLTNEK